MSRRYGYTDPETHQFRVSSEKPPIRMCDFCGLLEVHSIYDTEDHPLPNPDIPGLKLPTMVSTEGWAACQECARLINDERRGELLDRVFQIQSRRFSTRHHERPALRRYIASIQQSFWTAHRRPPA